MPDETPTTDSLEARIEDLNAQLSRRKRGGILGLVCAILLIPLFLFGIHIGERNAKRDLPVERTRPMTQGEDVYIRLSRMGFVDWTMACTYAIARDSRSWEEAKAKCSSDYLEHLRDLPDGASRPSPEEFARLRTPKQPAKDAAK